MLVDKNYIIFIIITVGRKGITKVDCGREGEWDVSSF